MTRPLYEMSPKYIFNHILRGTCLGPKWMLPFGPQDVMVRDAVFQHYWRFQRPLMPPSEVTGIMSRRVLAVSITTDHAFFEYNCMLAPISRNGIAKPGFPNTPLLYIAGTLFMKIP